MAVAVADFVDGGLSVGEPVIVLATTPREPFCKRLEPPGPPGLDPCPSSVRLQPAQPPGNERGQR